jgi:hypothetical protein
MPNKNKYSAAAKPGSHFYRRLARLVGLSLLVIALGACGDSSTPATSTGNATANKAGSPTAVKATSAATPSQTPEQVADQLAAALKAGEPSAALGVAQGNLGRLPVSFQSLVNGQDSSVGDLFRTGTYGKLVSYTPFRRLALPEGLDPDKLVVLESEFHYVLTNGIARLGLVRSSDGSRWTISLAHLDFDPPGIVVKEGQDDGLSVYQPKSLLEALNGQAVGAAAMAQASDTVARLDGGVPQVFGSGVGITTISNTDWYPSRRKPFAVSSKLSQDGKSAQWLVNFEGRTSTDVIEGTIRLLDGAPWGVWYESQYSNLYEKNSFTLASIKVDSTNFCQKQTTTWSCHNLSYNQHQSWAGIG